MKELLQSLLFKYHRMLKVWEVRLSVRHMEAAIAQAYATTYRPAPSLLARRIFRWGVPLCLLAGAAAYLAGPRWAGVRRPPRAAAAPAPAPAASAEAGAVPAVPAAEAAAPPVAAAAVEPSPPRSLQSFSYGMPLNILISDKTRKKLFVYSLTPKTHSLLKEYNTAIGEKWGQKTARGDLKTPEGFYWIVDQKEYPNLAPIYGKRAFILNYPNEEDVAIGRTGNGIWIHGTERDKAPDKTKGCLELSNDDIIELGRYVGPGTPILITEQADRPDQLIDLHFKYDLLALRTNSFSYRYRMKVKDAYAFVEKWRSAWEHRDLEQYAGLYAPEFRQQDMDYQQWKEYKRGVFAIPQPITVEISQVDLGEGAPDSASQIITFFQKYQSSTFSGEYYKQLVVVRQEGNGWKIQNEKQLTTF